MKKLGIIAMAIALVMMLSQCKKDDTTTPANDGEKVPITLKVSSNGAKHEVTPSTGEVTFEEGDMLHVTSNGVYLGTLEYQNSVFSGEINTPTEGLPLHFYFLGDLTPEFNSDNTGCSVVISDQTINLPVISYNTSRENYETGKTDYNARLMNQCALVKFEVTSSVPNSATSIMGMNNRVTVTFGSDEFGYDQVNDGKITLPAGEGERWAILLPQNEIANAIVRSADEMWEGSCGTIPAIAINDYLTDGILVAINHPTGVINSLFSVSASDQVYFSKGNLQYIGSAATPYWKFADNQWDYLGNTTGQNSEDQTIDRDLFGWGTSGYNHGAIAYQPWSTSTNSSDYFAYGNRQYHLYDQSGRADWGYNSILNGGNLIHTWRTLTSEEWIYLFNSRFSAKQKYGHGRVNEVNGIIILPDNWILPEGLNFIPGNSDWGNEYTLEQWNRMETAGAVFLPTAGYRVEFDINNEEISGSYWSSSNYNGYPANHARYFGFHSNGIYATYSDHRDRGYSVRLVQDY